MKRSPIHFRTLTATIAVMLSGHPPRQTQDFQKSMYIENISFITSGM